MKKLLYKKICAPLLSITLCSIPLYAASTRQEDPSTAFPLNNITKTLSITTSRKDKRHLLDLLYDPSPHKHHLLDLLYDPSAHETRMLTYQARRQTPYTLSLIIYDPFRNEKVQEIPLASDSDCKHYASFSTQGNYIALLSIYTRGPVYMLTLYYKSSYTNAIQHDFLTKHTSLPSPLVNIIADYHPCSDQYEEDEKKDLAENIWGGSRLFLQAAYHFHYDEATKSILCLQSIPSQFLASYNFMHALQIPLNGTAPQQRYTTLASGRASQTPQIRSSNRRFVAYYSANGSLLLWDRYDLLKTNIKSIPPVKGTPILIDNSGEYMLYKPTGKTEQIWGIQNIDSGECIFAFRSKEEINVKAMHYGHALILQPQNVVSFLTPPHIAEQRSPKPSTSSRGSWLKLTPRKLAGVAVCTVIAATVVGTMVQKNMLQRKR